MMNKPLKFINENVNSRFIRESFTPIDTLKSKLNQDTIATMNDACGGEDWSKGSADKWSDAMNMCDTVEQGNALAEIFLQISAPALHCNVSQLDPGKDIIIKLIRELGFKKNENPYLMFIPQFYMTKGNNSVVLTEDDWIMLNDLYADGTIDASDLKGTGRSRGNHIIFNGNLYKDGNISSDKINIVKAYEWLSEKSNINKLNLSAIAKMKDSPYSQLSAYANGGAGTRGSGKLVNGNDSALTSIRSIIMYKDPSQPLGAIQTFYWIKRAINVGVDNIYSGDTQQTGKNNALPTAQQTMANLSKDDRLKVIQWLQDNHLLQ